MNTTNFQPLSEQQCGEIGGGLTVINYLLGLPISLDLSSPSAIGNSLGTSLINLSSLASILLMNTGSLAGNLLGSPGNIR